MKNIAYIILAILSSSCTVSFQNVSTHGTANDLIDENQTAKPKISAPINLTPNLT